MASSFFNRSPRWGPTPFKYSIGLDNMCDENEIISAFPTKIGEYLNQIVKSMSSPLISGLG